ncbi:hypothetical protein GC170_01130 [bacterium]|nr:hypothetical protein [bacterium]
MNRLSFTLAAIASAVLLVTFPIEAQAGQLKAGAAAIDVSPPKFPVIVNGGFLQAIGSKNLDRLHSRAFVLDDGSTKLAIAVVDSCMMPRDLLDKAKEIASKATGIPVDRMMISATHTHTAPSAMWALGTPPDEDYVAFLPGKIAESIIAAHGKLQPARIGFASVDDYSHTHNRRWIRRPDKMVQDPFGKATGRAHMHPGYQNPEAVGPSGPVDPGLSVVSIQTPAGKPIALMANYSMHYFGIGPVSADYFGKFVTAIAGKIGAGSDPAFVGIMSQGTSGDLHWMDYSKPKTDMTIDRYAEEVAAKAFEAYGKIAYRDDISLAMAETVLNFVRRTPDAARLQWAKDLKSKMTGPVPKSVPEVYACEAIALDEDPRRELKLQAIRIGEIGIAAIPNEVYALTGLKIKAMSPLPATFNIELANGAEGYIPPPEQHALGGYTTWPARTAALEVPAETKITEAIVTLLEKVSNKPRRPMKAPLRPIDDILLKLDPVGYWRLEETGEMKVVDESGNENHGLYLDGIARYLPGPQWQESPNPDAINRAVHLAGGKIVVPVLRKQDFAKRTSESTISFWIRPGVPCDSFEKPINLIDAGSSFRIGLKGGGGNNAGKIFANLGSKEIVSTARATPGAWIHVVLTQTKKSMTLYVNGSRADEYAWPMESAPQISSNLAIGSFASYPTRELSINAVTRGEVKFDTNYEGKMDDIAVFDRALTADEVKSIYRKPVPFEGEQ